MGQPSNHTRGLVIAAPSSGSGKTTVTLGLLRALRNLDQVTTGAKCGPDYIDPRFHEAACGRPCFNLDPFAMSIERMQSMLPASGNLIVEGVMGLFDGAMDGAGSTASLARALDLPVVLVVDCAHTAQSVAALVAGFVNHDPKIKFAGLILNNVGSDRHENILRSALSSQPIPIFGAIHRRPTMAHPSRHLGLVQAQERADLDEYIELVATEIACQVDLRNITEAMQPAQRIEKARSQIAPPAQRIAVANDAAFAFAYPHILADWRSSGAEISTFSPLADEAPTSADFIMLPGGYPELYASQLSSNQRWQRAMRDAASQGVNIYGECGGYMVLGTGLTAADGTTHPMLGLLDLETSFAKRKLHLGYRRLSSDHAVWRGDWLAHEFHYATTVHSAGEPLFYAQDAARKSLPDMGLVNGNVCGSFAHIIDSARTKELDPKP